MSTGYTTAAIDSWAEMVASERRLHAARLRQLAAVGDNDLGLAGAALAAHTLDGLHHLHALCDVAKHAVLTVQPGGGHGAQEELRQATLPSG